MFGIRSAADRFRIGGQEDRGPWLQAIEVAVCGVIGHRVSVLVYDTFEVVEAFDPDEDEWYAACRDIEVPFLGCIRCLAEVEIELPPPVPVDIVDWS